MSICNDEKSRNLTVYLYKNCTLNCKFCFQKHSLFLKGIDVLDFDKIYHSIKNTANDKRLNINFTGGELFFSKDIIKKLMQLIDKLKTEYDLKIVPSSNLICDMELCYEFLDYLYENDLIVDFSTSFDFGHRFKNDAMIKLWFNNLNALQIKYPKLRIIINTIVTNELAEAFKTKQELYSKNIFEQLYKRFFIALQVLSVYDEKDFVSDETIKFTHDYFTSHFPNIVFLYTGYGKQCNYNSTYIIYGDGTAVKGCCENNYGEKVDLDVVKKMYVKYNKCLLCKKYGCCQHECYMEWWFRNRRNLENSKCYYKIVGEV